MAYDPTSPVPPVPALDAKGWVTDPAQKADLLLCYYLQSDKSQSTLMPGAIKSFQYTLQQNPKEPLELQAAIRSELSDYFDNYFEMIIVDVRVEVPKGPQFASDAMLDVSIDLTIADKGINYSVGKLISTIDSKISKIIDLHMV